MQDSHQGRECVANLGNNGTESWNKFFSGVGSDNCIITLSLHPAQKVHRYNIGVSGDHLERSPIAWEIWGLVKDGKKMQMLHVVDNEKFTKFFETKSYNFPEISDVKYRLIEFRCAAVAKNGAGLQLGRISLDSLVEGEFYEGEFQDDLPNGWGIYNYDNGNIVEGMFENGEPYKEDDATLCGEGGLFNPHAMISAFTEAPDLHEMGLDVPDCCQELYLGVKDIWDHFLETADGFGDDEIVMALHPRKIIPHPSVDDPTSLVSRGSSPQNTPEEMQKFIGELLRPTSLSPRTVTQMPTVTTGGDEKKNLKIVPKPKVANMLTASSDGVHVQAAPGVVASATEPPKSMNNAYTVPIDSSKNTTEDTNECVDGGYSKLSESSLDNCPKTEEEGLIVISDNEDVSSSYYIHQGLRIALSKADKNGYRHDAGDDEDDSCFLDSLFVMLSLKQTKRQFYLRGSLDFTPRGKSIMTNGAGNSMKADSTKLAHEPQMCDSPEEETTPQKSFGSLFAFSKSNKAKDAKIMTSSCDSGFVAPLTSAQAAAAPPTPSKSTGNSALAYFNRKFAAGQNAGPPPPVDNHHILRLDRDHTQASHYEPEPVGVLIGSQSEILSSRSEKGEKDATGGFDWSFGFMAGEETKHESPPSFSSSPGKSVLVATDSDSMQQPPSNTKTKSAGAPEASIASSNSQVQNSYTPRKNNHSFARKKEASQQNVQMYKPTRDGRAANSSKQSADASSSSNAATSTWGSWF